MNVNKKPLVKYLPAVMMLVLIVLVFFRFVRDNDNRIIEQNNSYIEDATVQVTQRVGDVLEHGQSRIRLISRLYGRSLDGREPKAADLADIAVDTPFDHVDFAGSDGIERSGGEAGKDVSDQVFFREGMEGRSGIDVIINGGEKDVENALIFYAPLRYEGEIIGVLTGHYMEEQLRELLTTRFFGQEARTLVCDRDGYTVAGSASSAAGQNILKYFGDSGMVSEETLAGMENALKNGTTYRFPFKSSNGTGIGCLMWMPETDMAVMQTFPSAVMSQMQRTANAAGVMLEISLVALFAVYILYLVWEYRNSRKQLLGEKQNVERIVAGVNCLFSRFLVVDLEEDTYRYLEEKNPFIDDLPQEGRYSELLTSFREKLVDETGQYRMAEMISKKWIQAALTEDVPFLRYEYCINRGEKPSWENGAVICLERKDGVPVKVLLAIQDITKIKEEDIRNREAMKQAFEAAEQANHAKSDFLSRMSHDIRTPMNAIMGMTAIATMHLGDQDRVEDCLKKITISSRHLLGLINEVLDMSKIESGKVSLSEEEFNLSDSVDSLLTMFHQQMEDKKQELKVNIGRIEHENVIGDPQRLQQVLVNLMGNAVKFTPEGGTICISIEEKPSNLRGNGCYEFIFEDTGIGMTKEFVDQIFEPFARAGDSRVSNIEGTGLGMPIARNIVRMMRGDIKVESEPGVGSRFTVTVFLRLREAEQEDIRLLADLNVLVVDDDQIACESACGILDGIGMNAEWVLSGDAAIRVLSENHNRGKDYAAVILDWKMPGKNGVETAREIRRTVSEDIPIIILSAYDWSPVEQEAREAGVDAFIAKPLFKSRLIYVMKTVLVGPDEASDTQVSGAESHPLQSRDYSGERILLVEDNELNREIAIELLETAGFMVDYAVNGREGADRLLNTEPGTYDLVLMDIQMPVMNGYEAARTIRASGREDLANIPIVAMTADAFVEDMRKAEEAGMNAHIAKPIELDKLARVLETWG